MPIHLQQLLQQIEEETERTLFLIDAARKHNREAPQKIQQWTMEQTEALVELARHYLPGLTHQALAQAWDEVRDQIREVLLRKEDRCRKFRQQRDEVRTRRQQLERETAQLQKELEKARLDLRSKSGNAHKMLREDEAVATCIQSIDAVDAEIDEGIALLDSAHAEAKKKLPEYEACHLFSYLRDRKFGTADYAGRGIERRWDRWVAKLIDYPKAKSSYDYLNGTPTYLQDLIDEKRRHYQSLLKQLDAARKRAMIKFGVGAQNRLWQSLGQQFGSVQQQLEQAEMEEAHVGEQLQQTENIHGEHYHQAIEIYRKFLRDLDPEILRVYAACTESPVDDQICARVRGIQQDIDVEEQRSCEREHKIVQHQKYVSGLHELTWRLRNHLRETPVAAEIDDSFPFSKSLSQLQQQERSPAEIWQQLRTVIAGRCSSKINLAETTPLDASFMAASGRAAEPRGSRSNPDTKTPPDRSGDLLNVVLIDPLENDAEHRVGFRMFAFCRTKSEALAVTTLLDAHGIRSFLHNHAFHHSPTVGGIHSLEEIIVMVEPSRLGDARQIVAQLQREGSKAWTCPACTSSVDRGYHFCWQCGKHRPIAALS